MVMQLVKNEFKYWDFIRRLRSDPKIQIGFVEKVNISPEQQAEYMAKYEDCYFICLSEDQKPIGFIGEVKNDIRVAVINEYQKMGVGKFMVNELMRLRPNSYAKMKFDNIASKKLFESCGFTCIKHDEEFYYYKKK